MRSVQGLTYAEMSNAIFCIDFAMKESTVKSVKYLIEGGLDDYDTCSAACEALELCENHMLKNNMACSYAARSLGFYFRPCTFNWMKQIFPLFWSAVNNKINVLKYL